MTATTWNPGTPCCSERTGLRALGFAHLWRRIDADADAQIRPAKTALFSDLPREIVEIGPGCGANFPYFSAGTRVLAFEPNVYLHDDLRAAAARHGIELDLRASDLAAGRLPDGSQELVVSTLVLCSVRDPDATLAEIHRILRPDGRLLFIEHVAAAKGSRQARYQRLVRGAWRALADGCDPCARTAEALRASELTITSAKLERFGSNLDPTNLVYFGVAVKRDDRAAAVTRAGRSATA